MALHGHTLKERLKLRKSKTPKELRDGAFPSDLNKMLDLQKKEKKKK